jgi:hypothetical protein
MNYLDKVKRKEDLENLKVEREKLNNIYIFFAYINKADLALKEQQFEMTIRLMNMAKEKYLKKFQINSAVYKRGNEMITSIQTKITNIV